MKQKILIVYGSDSSHDGKACGPKTIRHCKKAVDFIKAYSRSVSLRILLAAGKRPHRPKYPPLKLIMKNYFYYQFHSQSTLSYGSVTPIVLTRENAWSIYTQTKAMTKELGGFDDYELIVICSWYQVPKIFIAWLCLKPYDIFRIDFEVTY